MFKKFSLTLLLFAVCAIGQANLIANVVQPAAHTNGADISFTNGYYTVPGGVWFKGWEDTATEVTSEKVGILMAHLVMDGANTYTAIPVRAGAMQGYMIDKIRQNGTTPNLLARLIFYKTTN